MAETDQDRGWEDQDWEDILWTIKFQKCTPFLGAGASAGVLPLGGTIAQKWAVDHGYPLEGADDLARVAQFVAVKRGAMRPKYEIADQFKQAQDAVQPAADEPYPLLAGLPLPVYISTNYDDLMACALRDRDKDPQVELCQWNKIVKRQESIFEREPGFEPSETRPIVYHLHGHADTPESLVLTEDDYLDFLVSISREQDLIPARIQQAFVETSVLFLGYRLADWDFRVLFRSLAGYLERSIQQVHVSVQLLPVDEQVSPQLKDEVREYLDKYFGRLHIKVYWGTCGDFCRELARRWEAFNATGT